MTKEEALSVLFVKDDHLYQCVGALRDSAKGADKELYNQLRGLYQQTSSIIRKLQDRVESWEAKEDVGNGY